MKFFVTLLVAALVANANCKSASYESSSSSYTSNYGSGLSAKHGSSSSALNSGALVGGQPITVYLATPVSGVSGGFSSGGYSQGASAGLSTGLSSGYSRGASAGHSSGLSSGYSRGASAGLSTGASYGANYGSSYGSNAGYTASRSSSSSSQVSGPIHAAIVSTRNVEVIDGPSSEEPANPQTVVIGPNVQPLALEFHSQSSPLAVSQVHHAGQPQEYETERHEEQPDVLRQEIVKPVVQEVYETIQPVRRITQELKPVQEQVQQIVTRGEARQLAAYGQVQAARSGAYSQGVSQGQAASYGQTASYGQAARSTYGQSLGANYGANYGAVNSAYGQGAYGQAAYGQSSGARQSYGSSFQSSSASGGKPIALVITGQAQGIAHAVPKASAHQKSYSSESYTSETAY